MTAVILFAHGAKNDRWEKPMRRLADMLGKKLPDCRVSLAFLQFGEPKLLDQIDHDVKAGADRIVVLPYFLAKGGHLLSDLPKIIEEARKRHPEVTIEAADPIGEIPEVLEAMADAWARLVR